MATEYIKETELYDTFRDAQKFMAPVFQPLDEFERISRNKPHPGIAKELPKVTDGTLAGLIQETPKRIIQQIPTGKVVSDDDWLNLVAGFILEHEVLPNANAVASLIQKCWTLTSKALTYGAQPVFTQFMQRGEYFGTDFTLPYVKDVLLEPGKLSDRDSCIVFLRSWYLPSQIDGIIAKEEMLQKNAKDRGEKYTSPWNLTKLAALKDEKSQKDQQSMTAFERANNQMNNGFIEIVHCFQEGIGAYFYSFSPRTKETVRRKVNKDPRGKIPISYMYANIDMSNPLGRGSVELSGGMQNLLDSEVQSYQYMRALLMNPPLEVHGNVNTAAFKYAPKAIWKLGADPQNSVKPVQLSTSSLESFPNNYGLIKSQILQLNAGGGDTTTSADSGNVSSKTPQGVKLAEAKLGVSDNYMRKNFEDCFEEVCETMINLWFAERSGVQELQLDDDTAAKLKELQPDAVNDKNVIRIDYDTETPKLKFKVDASTSSMKDDADERDRLIELLDLSGKYPQIAQLMGQDGTTELINRIIVKSGVEDPEKIMPKPADNQQQTDAQGNPIPQDPNVPQDPNTPQGQPGGVDPQQIMQQVDQLIQQRMQEAKSGAQPKAISESIKWTTADFTPNELAQVKKEGGIEPDPTAPTPASVTHAVDTTSKIASMDPNHPQNQPDPNAQPPAGGQGAQDGQNGTPDTQDAPQPGDVQADPGNASVQGLTPDDTMLIEELRKRGYDDSQIGEAIAMLQHNTPIDEILKVLHPQQQPQPVGAPNG